MELKEGQKVRIHLKGASTLDSNNCSIYGTYVPFEMQELHGEIVTIFDIVCSGKSQESIVIEEHSWFLDVALVKPLKPLKRRKFEKDI